ncbi:MAG TPA: protein translocase subunit SecF, partial [Actinomycetota bacterium]|nr:protein translocase subunit SecF [Actinomycetota bacterium]
EQEKVADAVRELSGATVEESPRQQIGRKWGGEITSKAIKALLIFFLVIIAFISWRFEWKMAVGAFVALFHDLVITAGIYALVGFEVTPSTVIAILTILGYSLYDTVVVFDKVEENTSLYATTGRMTYEASANMAMNQVFMRSLNTSLATLLPVAALLFVGAGLLGATTLEDLALALFVGIAVGTYSSIFVATPILSLLKEREPRFQSVREKVLRDAKRQSRTAATPPMEEVTVGAPAAAATTTTPRATTQNRPQTRPRAGSKKAKRRKKR